MNFSKLILYITVFLVLVTLIVCVKVDIELDVQSDNAVVSTHKPFEAVMNGGHAEIDEAGETHEDNNEEEEEEEEEEDVADFDSVSSSHSCSSLHGKCVSSSACKKKKTSYTISKTGRCKKKSVCCVKRKTKPHRKPAPTPAPHPTPNISPIASGTETVQGCEPHW
jgi:hypothetical protein